MVNVDKTSVFRPGKGAMSKKTGIVTIAFLALVLASIMVISAGCGGSGSTGTTSPKGGVTSQGLGVPVYTGTTAEEVYPGVFKMTTTHGFDQVVAFYKKELREATFSEIKIDTGRGASFVVDMKGFNGNISVEENLLADGQVTVTVSKFKT